MATTDTRAAPPGIADIDALVRPSKLRRIAWLGLLAVVVAGTALFSYNRWFKAEAVVPPTIQEVTVSRGPLATTLTTSGAAAAGQSAALSFPSAGRVASVSVRVGDQVTAGQELARVEDRDVRRRLETAELSLAGAQTRLAQLLAPPTDSERRAASQAVVSARSQLLTAEGNLDTLTRGAESADLLASESTLAQAQRSVDSSQLNVETTYGLLLAAQNVLCTHHAITGVRCGPANVPLTPAVVELLGFLTGVTDVNSSPFLPGRARDLLSANTAYVGAVVNRDAAKQSLTVAEARHAALLAPPTTQELAQATAAITSAHSSLDSALAKEEELVRGATSFEIELARESVRSAEISLQQARDAVDDTVLRAPFDASVSAVAATAGAQSANPAVTINNPAAIRIDLTISESDLPSLKVGQYGIATFDALAGQPVVLRIRGISTLPTVTQGVVSYPVQAEIVTGDALRDAREQLASLLQATRPATAPAGPGGGAPAGGAPTGGAPAGGAGAGQRPAGAGAAGARGAGATAGTGAEAASIQPAPGMNASITVLLKVEENQLLVPNNAIKREGRQTFLTIKNESGAQEQVPVTLGSTNGTSTIVASGVDEGATVLIITAAPGTAATATAAAKAATTGGGNTGPVNFGGGQVK